MRAHAETPCPFSPESPDPVAARLCLGYALVVRQRLPHLRRSARVGHARPMWPFAGFPWADPGTTLRYCDGPMVDDATLRAALTHTLGETNFDALGAKYEGKVRDNYTTTDGRRFIVVTDRISAFDRVLGTIPFKGQVLNRLAAWWFEKTQDVAPNHMLARARSERPRVRRVHAAPRRDGRARLRDGRRPRRASGRTTSAACASSAATSCPTG